MVHFLFKIIRLTPNQIKKINFYVSVYSLLLFLNLFYVIRNSFGVTLVKIRILVFFRILYIWLIKTKKNTGSKNCNEINI